MKDSSLIRDLLQTFIQLVNVPLSVAMVTRNYVMKIIHLTLTELFYDYRRISGIRSHVYCLVNSETRGIAERVSVASIDLYLTWNDCVRNKRICRKTMDIKS
jgi:hypothetical protein